jgi:glycosyltransferase involved in cell wall biosynthesis
MAYLHFTGVNSFPVSPAFFGQTFVIGNLTAAVRYGGQDDNTRNITYTNKPQNSSGSELLTGPVAQRLAREKFFTELRVGYGLDRLDSMVSALESLIQEGFRPVMLFHYPLCDSIFSHELGKELQLRGIRNQVSIVYYLHTLADNIVFQMQGDNFRKKHVAMFRALDGTIAVCDAVRESYLRLELEDNDEKVRLDPDANFVVHNGIAPTIYSVRSESELLEARRRLGFADNVDKLVSYVGRLDSIKGSDFLIGVLRHYENSHAPDDNSVGFLIGTSHIMKPRCMSKRLKEVLGMERLIRENRLKLVLDISKFVRGDPRFGEDVEGFLRDYARPDGFCEFEKLQVYGGMATIPVQTISDVYLHPSRSEACPLAVVEAVFGGAYVIATNVGGIPEIVDGQHLGSLVTIPNIVLNPNSGRPKDYAAGMAELVQALIQEVKHAISNRPERYIGARLQEQLGRHTDLNMFKQFKAAISGIVERQRGWVD